ncbi:MAG: hypothetical protein ACK58N_04385 [Synechocystis sp.]
MAAHERFKKRVESNQKDKQVVLAPKPKGMKKLSEVLQEFIEPYVDDEDTYEERFELLEDAIIVWNASLLPEEKRQGFIEEFFDLTADPLDKEDVAITNILKLFIKELMDRKLELYANDNRFIKDFQLTEHELGFHLSVAYSLH